MENTEYLSHRNIRSHTSHATPKPDQIIEVTSPRLAAPASTRASSCALQKSNARFNRSIKLITCGRRKRDKGGGQGMGQREQRWCERVAGGDEPSAARSQRDNQGDAPTKRWDRPWKRTGGRWIQWDGRKHRRDGRRIQRTTPTIPPALRASRLASWTTLLLQIIPPPAVVCRFAPHPAPHRLLRLQALVRCGASQPTAHAAPLPPPPPLRGVGSQLDLRCKPLFRRPQQRPPAELGLARGHPSPTGDRCCSPAAQTTPLGQHVAGQSAASGGSGIATIILPIRYHNTATPLPPDAAAPTPCWCCGLHSSAEQGMSTCPARSEWPRPRSSLSTGSSGALAHSAFRNDWRPARLVGSGDAGMSAGVPAGK